MGVDVLNFQIETEQEEDGRWIAEVIGTPGVLAYGKTVEDAIARVQSLAALLQIGWSVKRQSGTSHRVLA
jgi:hypothetical protein